MLDSESQLREAIQKMLKPKQAGETVPRTAEGTNAIPDHATSHQGMPATAESAGPTAVKYICPMPEHVSIEYNQPGKCPLCGMTLVPVSQAMLKITTRREAAPLHLPDAEHSDVHQDKPGGNCPKCGMTLIPVMEAPPVPASSATSAAIPSTLYTCPMEAHADVVSDKPGKCPKCEMELVQTAQ